MNSKLLRLSAAACVFALSASSASAENGLYAGGSLGMSATGFQYKADGYSLHRDGLETYRRQDFWANSDATTRHQDVSGFLGYRRDLKTLDNGATIFGRVEGGFSIGSSAVTQSNVMGDTVYGVPYDIQVTRGNSAFSALHLGVERNSWRVYSLGGLTAAQQSVAVQAWAFEDSLIEESGTVSFLDVGFGIERDVSEKLAVRLQFKHSIDPNGKSKKFVHPHPDAYYEADSTGAFTNSTVSVGMTFKF